MINVFVYGTLRKGEGNHRLLEGATCMAEQAWAIGTLYDTGYGYPAMKSAKNSRVYGELYSITESTLAALDQLEGFTAGGTHNLYERIQQTVHTDKGSVLAYLYVAATDHLCHKPISSGDWKEYRLTTNASEHILYFAYGSCMDQQRFIEHGVSHYFKEVMGVGSLPNYTLRFTRKSTSDNKGRADIVEEGGMVEGKVYKIPTEALKEYLYSREGAPFTYRVTFVTVELHGRNVQALTFVVVDKKEEIAPPHWYEEEILRGASGYLTTEYVDRIKRHIDSLKKQKQQIWGM
ncbi:gamma-glutamylcyclotransferase [Bacillus timonensis]|nr:gamma-glutamylcyclotransferase [Bacillus timonensis]